MSEQIDLWIIDDDESIRWVLEKSIEQEAITFQSFANADDALDELPHSQPKAIVCDVRMPGISGMEFLEKLNSANPDIPIIIMTAHSDLDSAVSAYQGGAFDYLAKPFDIDEAIHFIKRALALHQPQIENTHKSQAVQGLIGEAPAMQEVFRAIGRLSQSAINVLINGESGTGKELVAQALHQHSNRANKKFIAINVAAIPKDLIESELFGHEKGAFTGAAAMHKGRFEQANGGTLFLDEIGDMPADAQTRLLRVLATGEFYRIGGQQPVQVDVRIITATHQNLLELVEQKLFREDLYHRLNVIRIQLPKLNQRREDIPLLSEYFLQKIAHELNTEKKQLDAETLKLFEQLEWPGNVRQLENTCRWLTVMAPGSSVSIQDLPSDLLAQSKAPADNTDQQTGYLTRQQILNLWIKQLLEEKKANISNIVQAEIDSALISQTLKHTQGKRAQAAKILGWGRNTLTRKIQDLDLDV